METYTTPEVGTVASDEGRASPPTTEDIFEKFLLLQAGYSGRNGTLSGFSNLFGGDQWSGDAEDDTSYQLTMNYLRNVCLRFAAILSRSPKPSVPIPVIPELAAQANRREKFLMALWPDIMRAWRDVEMNASKLGYGVLQVLWAPKDGQPENVNVGLGLDQQMQRSYTKSPFIFRSTPPMNFYPMYRTYDTPNDFLYVFRYEPNRAIRDLEERYGVELQSTGQDERLTEETVELIEYWDNDWYKLIALTHQDVKVGGTDRNPRFEKRDVFVTLEEGSNPYGCIPFWVLQNIRTDPNVDPTDGGSLSDIEDLIIPQKHYNEMFSEEAQEIATNIHRPLVYQSADHQADVASLEFKAGAVFPIGPKEDESLEPLAYTSTGPGVREHLAAVMQAIKDLSFLGDAGFGQLASGVSGVGFGIALNPLQQITELKIPLRVDALRSVSAYLLRCFEKKAESDTAFRGWYMIQGKRFGVAHLTAGDIGGNYFTEIVYGNLLPRDDYAHEQNEIYKYKTGAQSLETTLDHLGYDDPQAEVERIKKEQQDPVLNPEKVIAIAQAKQMTAQPQPQPGATAGAAPATKRPAPTSNVSQGPPVPPGAAQPGTSPINMEGFGGMAGVPGGAGPLGGPQPFARPGGAQEPPVPNKMAFPGRPGMPEQGPGQNAPFLKRR